MYEGEKWVLLPCYHSHFIPDDPTVMWTRNDLNPKVVHKNNEIDDFQEQNQHYNGRTSMRSDALDSLDFSLTLRKPNLEDSGNYTCSITDGREEEKLGKVQLLVKGQK